MSLDAAETVVIPGWYPDPSNENQARWWDGSNWTELVKPVANAPAPEPEIDRYFSAELGRKEAALPPIDPFRPSDHRYNSQGFVSMEAKPIHRFSPTRAYTASVWWLATMPIWATAVILALTLGLGDYFSLFPRFMSGIILYLVAATLTIQDRKSLLNQLHPSAASAWWFLLGPFIYLIARAVHVTHNTGRGWAPVLVYAISSVVPITAVLAFSSLLIAFQVLLHQ
ncbi:MAG: DUF2510 domain-containing protein [Microbacteriaceae bacterium]|nr:DUF2510 domain-containing protein [Microbacteriaceae bacterium]